MIYYRGKSVRACAGDSARHVGKYVTYAKADSKETPHWVTAGMQLSTTTAEQCYCCSITTARTVCLPAPPDGHRRRRSRRRRLLVGKRDGPPVGSAVPPWRPALNTVRPEIVDREHGKVWLENFLGIRHRWQCQVFLPWPRISWSGNCPSLSHEFKGGVKGSVVPLGPN